MTLNELQKWMLSNDVADSWWVALDGEVLDNLMSLPDVSRLKEEHPAALVAVLHESKADEENVEWIPFQKNEPTRFKVVTARRYDGMQVSVPSGDADSTAPSNPAPAPAAPVQQAPAPTPASQVPAQPVAQVNSEEVALLQEQVEAMRQEFENLRVEVIELRNLADKLKKPILEAQQILEERERFLELSESSLFDKAQKQEVLQVELEQLREELHTREAALREREAALQC